MLAALVVIALAPMAARPVFAAHTHHLHHRIRHRVGVHHSGPLYRAVLLEDADSGRVLYQENADMQWPPASMAKMMLLLVATDQIRAGRFRYTDPVVISARSAYTGGSRLGLRQGQVYPLGELMKAALIRSANDAAVAVAEKIGGSVAGAVAMMNARARSLGMTETHYQTVDGLPPTPGHDVDFTSARDLATLGRVLIYQTDLLSWSRLQMASFDYGAAMLHNTNHLIGHFDGCDGLKTGFTFKAGFNLTATARRGDMRLIAVVLGAPSNAQRFAQAARFLQWGFDNFVRIAILKGGQPLPLQVRTASGAIIDPVTARPVSVVVRKDSIRDIHLHYDVPQVLATQVEAGMPIGQVEIMDGADVLDDVSAIYPLSSIGKPGVTNGVAISESDRNNSQAAPRQ